MRRLILVVLLALAIASCGSGDDGPHVGIVTAKDYDAPWTQQIGGYWAGKVYIAPQIINHGPSYRLHMRDEATGDEGWVSVTYNTFEMCEVGRVCDVEAQP